MLNKYSIDLYLVSIFTLLSLLSVRTFSVEELGSDCNDICI